MLAWKKSKKLKINKMAKEKLESTATASLSWTPVMGKDGTYCSPACGAGCKHEDYVKAFGLAEGLAKKCSEEVGGTWKPVVHENLGWHWCVRQEGSNAEIRYGGYLAKGTGYSVGFSGGTPAQVAVRGSFETPKQAYDALMAEVAREAERWNSLLRNSSGFDVHVIGAPDHGPLFVRLSSEEAEKVRARVQEGLDFAGSSNVAYVKVLGTGDPIL